MADLNDLKERIITLECKLDAMLDAHESNIKALRARCIRLRQEMDALHGGGIGDPIPDIGREAMTPKQFAHFIAARDYADAE
jgi:hypothetical protein